MQFQLTARTGHPDFLDLPWDRPLAEWSGDNLVEVSRGIHRHVVRFVHQGGRLYAFKELPRRLAEREYRLLRELATEQLPVVEVVGVASDRVSHEGEPLEAVLITRHLEFALPYRVLFTRGGLPGLRDRLLDALAGLLVRLHLVGFYWGDCSLSNALFRRDAGALAAYLVDAETGELHPELSAGQREHDLEIARTNIAGELLDVEAELGVDLDFDPLETAAAIDTCYQALWSELVSEEVFGPDERFRVDARLRRINELGFDVAEIDLVTVDDGQLMRLRTQVVELGHHRRRLLSLTGLDVQENQARRLLNDLTQFAAHLREDVGEQLPDPVVAFRWLSEVFEPTIALVPPELRGKREPAEVFHEVLEHKYLRSAELGHDVGLAEAALSYLHEVLPAQPDERSLLSEGDD